jgi:three-Cys-motif partner protein
MEQLPKPIDDQLETGEVGPWAEEKYQILWLYASLFSSGMKYKWDKRVYVDLYAASGHARVKGTSRLVYGSPLLALQVRSPFDKYVFCEESHERIRALEVRAKTLAPHADITVLEGDCNERIEDIIAAIPEPSRKQRVLTLCFVDPFSMGIRFSTLEKLATARFTDFLVLLALFMDANRNYDVYIEEESGRVADFLGDPKWRDRWKVAQQAGKAFPAFLAEAFTSRMVSLGYSPPPPMKTVRYQDRNIRLYQLAIFSKSTVAYQFWDDVLKYSTDQIGFSF